MENHQQELASRQAGIIKEKENLERKISQNLQLLAKELSNGEIESLIGKLHTEKDLDALRTELEKWEKIEGKAFSEKTKQALADLIENSKRMTELRLETLKIEIQTSGESSDSSKRYAEYVAEPSAYPSHRYEIIQKLEKSKLGEKWHVDVIGWIVGAIDSAVILMQTLLTILKDIVLLPKDLYGIWKWQDR